MKTVPLESSAICFQLAFFPAQGAEDPLGTRHANAGNSLDTSRQRRPKQGPSIPQVTQPRRTVET